MTNKEFLEKISQKTHLEMDDVKELSSSLVGAVLEEIAKGNSVTIQGFGSFEPREKASRRIYNPTSKTYLVVPSKTTLSYKMSVALKTQLNKE
ncbi:MAG: HU family DNA-binding protein [Bacteroidaceae bacterium]|jgi:DNA-binding protein HU-beta|nr:HU family DNA-binding protein [Bacteroidaceae bacterium]